MTRRSRPRFRATALCVAAALLAGCSEDLNNLLEYQKTAARRYDDPAFRNVHEGDDMARMSARYRFARATGATGPVRAPERLSDEDTATLRLMYAAQRLETAQPALLESRLNAMTGEDVWASLDDTARRAVAPLLSRAAVAR